jgi:hypothetical protein
MNVQKNKYYMMSVSKGSNVTYLYTGDFAQEGLYSVKVLGVLKNYTGIHTVIAGAIPYTGNASDIQLSHFSNFENGVAISITEESPQFNAPNDNFVKIIKYQLSWNPCKKPPPDYY